MRFGLACSIRRRSPSQNRALAWPQSSLALTVRRIMMRPRSLFGLYLATLATLASGNNSLKPTPADHYWRISNAANVPARPSVREVLLYTDAACTKSLSLPSDGGWTNAPSACAASGCDLCSGWDASGSESTDGCSRVMDGSTDNAWHPQDAVASSGIYAAGEIWLKLKFADAPTMIGCVIVHGLGEQQPVAYGESWSGGLRVESSSDGTTWTPQRRAPHSDQVGTTDPDTFAVASPFTYKIEWETSYLNGWHFAPLGDATCDFGDTQFNNGYCTDSNVKSTTLYTGASSAPTIAAKLVNNAWKNAGAPCVPYGCSIKVDSSGSPETWTPYFRTNNWHSGTAATGSGCAGFRLLCRGRPGEYARSMGIKPIVAMPSGHPKLGSAGCSGVNTREAGMPLGDLGSAQGSCTGSGGDETGMMLGANGNSVNDWGSIADTVSSYIGTVVPARARATSPLLFSSSSTSSSSPAIGCETQHPACLCPTFPRL